MSKKNKLAKRTDVPFTKEQLASAASGGMSIRARKDGSYVLRGVTTDLFMSPGQPLAPQQQSIMGRQFDYQVGQNYTYTPRGSETLSFAMLRALADGYDMLRLAIETRKDQICKMQWQIVNKDKAKKVDEDERAKRITEFFACPDQVNTWQTWLRILMEDQLVIDAPCLYPRLNMGGGLYALEIMDGATIKPVIDEFGRRPAAPQPAYQQIIKGLPVVDYTADELLYLPRNKRSWKLYGQSPVEQVVMTVNIALRRQIHQLQFYTEGNIPEALICVPETWTPAQIKDMQTIWDSLLEGNTAQRRHAKFIPGSQSITFTKDAALKDEYDEWLARVICYAFSLSPQAFVKQMNRATAESAQEAALEEGLAPIMEWVRDVINMVIVKFFGYDDLCFKWKEEEDLDPKTQAEVNQIYLTAGVLDADEVRNDLGRDARKAAKSTDGAPGGTPSADGVTAGTSPVTATGASPVVPGGMPAAGGETVQDTAMNGTQVSSLLEVVAEVAGKNLPPESAKALIQAAFPKISPDLIDGMLNPLASFEKPVPPAPVIAGIPGAAQTPPGKAAPGKPAPAAAVPGKKPNEPGVKTAAPLAKALGAAKARATAQLSKALVKALSKAKGSIIKQVLKGIPLEKAKATNVLAELDFSAMDDVYDAALAASTAVAVDSASSALSEVGADSDRLTKLANSRAERWASQRAAELIKSDASGGELVDATREMLRSTVLEAEQNGWSTGQLQAELEKNYAFSADRAETIARTEMKIADSQGAMVGYRSSGVVKGKLWQTSDGDCCDECQANEDAGEVDLDEDFPSGDDTAPAHPNCNCSVSPVLDDEFTSQGD